MTGQLTFALPPLSTLTRADFFVSAANDAGLQAIDNWQNWPQGKLLLVGPSGSGKTHLAHIWSAEAKAVIIEAANLGSVDIPNLGPHIVVENADAIAGDQALETALFHLHNLTLPHGRMLITAATPPRDWGLHLPDLHSRLQAAWLARLTPPDDALLTAVLIKLFSDHQITVAPNLIAYLAARIDRSIAAAQSIVAALDAYALVSGRPITRQLAAELLDRPQAQ